MSRSNDQAGLLQHETSDNDGICISRDCSACLADRVYAASHVRRTYPLYHYQTNRLGVPLDQNTTPWVPRSTSDSEGIRGEDVEVLWWLEELGGRVGG